MIFISIFVSLELENYVVVGEDGVFEVLDGSLLGEGEGGEVIGDGE
jgi:hypothetical protein